MDVQQILFQHQQCTRLWHQQDPSITGDGFVAMVQQNHFENFSLWHEEDIARRNDLGAERVLQAKRAIDRACRCKWSIDQGRSQVLRGNNRDTRSSGTPSR